MNISKRVFTKPRIYCIAPNAWRCEFGGIIGRGITPLWAYQDWEQIVMKQAGDAT